ncbi:hypothetical protein G7Y89_g15790 [Cudoniella acicularis]|uniref:Adenosine deaminase domain-containing protein n=1 Tax=Cudoniella acicularis TaxID=354080 RepID=A0A8H4QF69_9HELO|nr:hypothetical protein G7Y89_g15790 [Cudoniella acicularis]
MTRPIPYTLLQTWKQECRTLIQSPSPSSLFLHNLPKLELHIHIEGTLSPTLRHRLAARNHLLPLTSNSPLHPQKEIHTLLQLHSLYDNLLSPISTKGPGPSAFFEAYYGSMEVLVHEEDFYDLAIEYFRHAAKMNIRYCEPMFDAQAHTRRGVEMETFMKVFAREDRC